jgi:hypothetical protein
MFARILKTLRADILFLPHCVGCLSGEVLKATFFKAIGDMGCSGLSTIKLPGITHS